MVQLKITHRAFIIIHLILVILFLDFAHHHFFLEVDGFDIINFYMKAKERLEMYLSVVFSRCFSHILRAISVIAFWWAIQVRLPLLAKFVINFRNFQRSKADSCQRRTIYPLSLPDIEHLLLFLKGKWTSREFANDTSSASTWRTDTSILLPLSHESVRSCLQCASKHFNSKSSTFFKLEAIQISIFF